MMFVYIIYCFFFFKQKTAYEMRISDWSSDVCSSDLDFPLIVTVALDRSAALAGWRRFVWVVALANFLVGALILLLYSVLARRRLERQIASQKALAAEKMEAVGLMPSSVAHELSNVLSATEAGVHLLAKAGPEETMTS